MIIDIVVYNFFMIICAAFFVLFSFRMEISAKTYYKFIAYWNLITKRERINCKTVRTSSRTGLNGKEEKKSLELLRTGICSRYFAIYITCIRVACRYYMVCPRKLTRACLHNVKVWTPHRLVNIVRNGLIEAIKKEKKKIASVRL